MKFIVVAIRDRALDAHMRPFCMQSKGQAIRSFADEINRAAPDNALHQHPEDYDLFQLGTWDEETGEFANLREQIAIGKDLVINKE